MIIHTKQFVKGQIDLTLEECNAISTLLHSLDLLKSISERADIVNPMTGQIFDEDNFEEVIDLLKTIQYYDEYKISFEIREED